MSYLKISLGIFLALAASRFVPHPPNFTSLIALSFYVPAFLGPNYILALIFGFILTDLVIGFHSLTIFTWGSVFMIGYLSKYLSHYAQNEKIWKIINLFIIGFISLLTIYVILETIN